LLRGGALLAVAGHPTFLSPLVREAPAHHELSMNLRSKKTNVTSPDTVACLARGSRLRTDSYRSGDLVQVILNTTEVPGASSLPAELWGRLESFVEAGFECELMVEPGCAATIAGRLQGGIDATVLLHRALHVPCDLYSLGLLWFRALLVNDGRDLFAVQDAVQRILDQLQVVHRSKSGNGDGAEAERRRRVGQSLLHLCEEERETFQRAAILHRRDDRQRLAELEDGGGIPGPRWFELLGCGCRLCSNLAGFSVCADHADFPADRPWQVMDTVLAELETFQQRLQVEAFGQRQRARDFAQVCQALSTAAAGVQPARP
jgi:hypothetical protein